MKECTSREHADYSHNYDASSFFGDFWFWIFVLVHIDLPSLQSLTMKGENFKYFSKIVVRSVIPCWLCFVDVSKLRNIRAPGKGYFNNVVNFVIDSLDEWSYWEIDAPVLESYIKTCLLWLWSWLLCLFESETLFLRNRSILYYITRLDTNHEELCHFLSNSIFHKSEWIHLWSN